MATISRRAEWLVLRPQPPPPLDAEESVRSAELAARIRARAAARGGWLPFSRFMQAALYERGLGYYMAEHPIFGAAGDFVTGPEMSPVFAACLVNTLAGYLALAGSGDVVEYGAGSGRMAAEIIAGLARNDVLPRRYRIVEPSPVLARRQRAFIERRPGTAGLADRFEWLDAPPTEAWRGVALANEVLDALPCERFRVTAGGCEVLGVAPVGDGFAWVAGAADAALAQAVTRLQSRLPAPMPEGFLSELRLGQREWIRSATAALERGLMLVIDYGLPRAQYYHPSRDGGTLCGFRRQLRVDDALAMPGAQDLTAWVDFSAVADEARDSGLEVGGFTTQAHYLLSAGIERELAQLVEGASELERAALSQGAATLLLPGEMGERFKVMALTRGICGPFGGFGFRDLSGSL